MKTKLSTQINGRLMALTAALVTFLLVFSSCDKGINSVGNEIEDSELLILTTNNLIRTDNGVVVNGATVFQSFRLDSAVILQDQTSYLYRVDGFDPGFDFISKFIGLNITLNRAPRGNFNDPNFKFVFDHLDIGDLTLNGDSVTSITADEVDFADVTEDRLEILNFKIYNYPIYTSHFTTEGREIIDFNSPVKSVLDSNGLLELTGANSTQVEDFNQMFSAERGPEIVSLTNGNQLNFKTEIPRITAGSDLTISFNRELLAGSTYIVFAPVPDPGSPLIFEDSKPLIAFATLAENTNEITFPTEVLTELKANSTVTSQLYDLTVYHQEKISDLDFILKDSGTVHQFPVINETGRNMFVIFNP